MISTLELRHIIESSFLPVECICSPNDAGTLTIQLINPETKEIDLTVPGIPVSNLTTMRAISDLVAQIREELRLTHLAHSDPRPRSNARS
ncbi:DUF1652 domain-containing protein [Pseudomonas sp. UBA1879]|uniref:DUF1652 domain-containing protein n=1 Tax=Pseudomonas sp. UBA1879 TaxID=1947305 RepID=UPI0025F3B410|nr:DUF1652 domain-containing protein [Pseudomonas sp. UBA1879]